MAPTDAPSVSIGPFVSETDEAERDREKQETRRLLYVALTRARDRLYLSSALKDGTLVPGRGSLAEVLPESIKELFGRAATVFEAVRHDWMDRRVGALLRVEDLQDSRESGGPCSRLPLSGTSLRTRPARFGPIGEAPADQTFGYGMARGSFRQASRGARQNWKRHDRRAGPPLASGEFEVDRPG